ncbi:Ppx/GppA phosphatase family protein [Paenibacillus gallinarum]|uniref:Ppx/GppA family phosphatase n=1 Tax=Paenibacillus gallinarum TaxID=2762232 RepID=A0ABR8T1N8_9BACL|nr:Ppx/GppA phosphatase family protein [Paenibacillus gallinarum]MBD7969669.1 Ppx/GppA family phosphatase [Paenibacillus gallinarum]
MSERIGIIDIGSNSIRLVIYEVLNIGAYRVLYEKKYAARLSQKVDTDGTISYEAISSILPVLRSYQEICASYQVTHVRAAATAAIRNAQNSSDITKWIKEETSLEIQLISGEDEGRLGFLGVIESISLSDGFIIDIGGGSTEITLFLNGEYHESLSIPYGAVNAHARYGTSTHWSREMVDDFRSSIHTFLKEHAWTQQHPGLTLVGLGGTVRSLAKMVQKKQEYSLPVMHNYRMESEDIRVFYNTLPYIPSDQRKKTPGLSKDRADLIIPGVILLQTIFDWLESTHYIVSGAGLRDGLFYELMQKDYPEYMKQEVLTKSIWNLLHFHSSAPAGHMNQVHSCMQQLYQVLEGEASLSDSRIMYASSMLYRIGEQIQHHRASQHSLYWIKNHGVWGLSHRETIITAIIADYHPKGRTPAEIDSHQDILYSEDYKRITRLGSLLRLASALYGNGGTVVESMTIDKKDDFLQLNLTCRRMPSMEQKELEDIKKEVEKAWKVHLYWTISISSKS